MKSLELYVANSKYKKDHETKPNLLRFLGSKTPRTPKSPRSESTNGRHSLRKKTGFMSFAQKSNEVIIAAKD